MPFIDLRTTVPAAPAQREALKTAFGQAITALHKTETYLMVSIQDSCELWLGGEKLDKGAYVAVSLYGSASSADYNRMTGLVCNILAEHLGLPPKSVYVTYHPVSDWGWNGRTCAWRISGMWRSTGLRWGWAVIWTSASSIRCRICW